MMRSGSLLSRTRILLAATPQPFGGAGGPRGAVSSAKVRTQWLPTSESSTAKTRMKIEDMPTEFPEMSTVQRDPMSIWRWLMNFPWKWFFLYMGMWTMFAKPAILFFKGVDVDSEDQLEAYNRKIEAGQEQKKLWMERKREEYLEIRAQREAAQKQRQLEKQIG
eukprot:PhM_4_TR9441/c0_g1_i1/m.25443